MLNLIKMEWYKLRTSKLFMILLGICFAFNILIAAVLPLVTKLLTGVIAPVNLSDALKSPFSLSLLLIVVFISATSCGNMSE